MSLPAASSADSADDSIFMRALNRYMEQLDEKKLHKRKFLADCISLSRDSKPDAQTVNALIQEAEMKNAERKKPLIKYLKPIIDALVAFDGVVSDIASSHPVPASIIWAALSFIIKGAHRYFGLFDKIRRELNTLSFELGRIAEYENLYGSSENMRNLLCDSYMSVLRFWSAVEKQCKESFIKATLKQAFSFNTDKLNEIIQEIKDNSVGIEKLAQITEARLAKFAREDADREWKEAHIERIEGRKERQVASRFREEQRQECQDGRYRNLCDWLGSQKANSSNTSRHKTNIGNRAKMTCQWLLSNSDYVTWKHGGADISDLVSEHILWVHGPPGSGKTFLCSRAIQDIQEAYPDAAVVYHFFQFDKSYTVAETLGILADSLFQVYWDRHRRVSEELYNPTQRNLHRQESIEEVIRLLVKNSSFEKVFFFLDGLDEESDEREIPFSDSRWDAASTVLGFIISLMERSPSVIHLWCSSQNHPRIPRLFSTRKITVLDIKEDSKEDAKFYLTAKISELGGQEFSDEQKREIMSKLKERVRDEGNFLWAYFMIRGIWEADDLSKVKAFITESHPSDLDKHYRKIFSRIDTRHKQLACEVFALITFVRRPLRIKEIREAVGILRNPKNPKESMPFSSKMERIFAPLIELRRASVNDADEERTCHLFHSTVRTFLYKHSEIFRYEPQDMGCTMTCCRITPNAIANACLLYLSQDCYARLLRKSDDGMWRVTDSSEQLVEDHRFLIYSAKYWDKHLDDLNILDSPDILKERVRAFMTSSNFQTCIQVQTLWVDGQFGTFRTRASSNQFFLRRLLPEWFMKSEDEGFKALGQNYRLFLREWRAFLCGCMKCYNTECTLSLYAGQVDRCWWAALGPGNFLSKLPGRYTSFAFQEVSDRNVDWEKDNLCEGICISGNSLKILRLERHDRVSKSLSFLCEHWTLQGASLPVLIKRQSIRTDERSTNWPTYTTHSEDDFKMRNGRAPPAAFNSDCSSLRLGAQIFILDENGDFSPVEKLDAGQVDASWQSSYFDDWAIRGNYVVLANRRNIPTRKINETPSEDDIGQDLDDKWSGNNADEEGEGQEESIEGSESDEEDYEDDQISDDSTSNDSDDEAYESWSECSTELSEDFLFEDDIITPWAGPESDLDNDTDTTTDTSESQSEVGSDDDTDDKHSETVNEESIVGEAEEDTDSDSDYVHPSAIVGCGELYNDDKGQFWDDVDDHASRPSNEESSDDDGSVRYYGPVHYYRSYGSKTKDQEGMHASITVFDTQSLATKVFHFSQQVHHVLYDSPPVIHPTSSLLVWPLGCGDVLFADFLKNTHFSRRLRPSTAYTRHIFMKCRFSLCGQYLHVACLEGQPQQRKKDSKSLRLALMVSTYRLCGKKTSRSPPTLIHRARISLGDESHISVSNLPYTLTWTPKELYFTCSRVELKVYRVYLFNPNKGNPDGNIPSVMVPMGVLLLPKTAQRRKVYFFPPDDDLYLSRVIIGSEMMPEEGQDEDTEHDVIVHHGHNYYGIDGSVLSPPIGCYLQQADLGDWVESKDRSKIPTDLGIGQFDRLLEKFNPEDDCDLEPYLF